jgi:uncharacterized protein (TIGR03435 family)
MQTESRSMLMMLGVAMAMFSGTAARAQRAPALTITPLVAGGGGGNVNIWARIRQTPQNLSFQADRLPDIIAFAYDLPAERIEGQPQWMYDNRFNLELTSEAPTALPEQKLMLQKLLAQRFGLVVHRISYPSPVYHLVAGPKVNLTPAQDPDAEGLPELHSVLEPDQYKVVLEHASLKDLAATLSAQLQLPVVDETGIAGRFDIDVSGWQVRVSAEIAIPAIRKSLGLDLQVHSGSAESLIIDSSHMPNEN